MADVPRGGDRESLLIVLRELWFFSRPLSAREFRYFHVRDFDFDIFHSLPPRRRRTVESSDSCGSRYRRDLKIGRVSAILRLPLDFPLPRSR